MRFLSSKVLILLSVSLLALACGSDKVSQPAPKPDTDQAAKDQAAKDAQAELDEEKAKLRDENDKMAQQKAELEDEKKKLTDTAETTARNQDIFLKSVQEQKQIAENSRDPVERLVAQLVLNQNKPVLVVAVGPSHDQVEGIENELVTLNGQGHFYTLVDHLPNGSFAGRFVVHFNSINSFKTFQDYAKTNAPLIKVSFFPVEKVLVRSYIEMSYSKDQIVKNNTYVNRFWIGDSPPAQLPSNDQPDAFADLNVANPLLKDCGAVNVDCVKTLIDHGYFKQTSWIDGQPRDPIPYLASHLGEATFLQGDQGYRGKFSIRHPQNSLQPVLNEINLVNVLWVVSDLSAYPQLVEAYGNAASSYVEELGAEGAYKTPLISTAHTPAITGDKNLDLPVATHQLYNYFCSLTPCFAQ